ncbi:MAG: hypothetical protein KDA87_20665 [Planctomycetales bacterium]|nr:hypothetical protein [Planctomycetales bacterium]
MAVCANASTLSAQGFVPNVPPGSGVSLNGITPFDPYAADPGLPPPIGYNPAVGPVPPSGGLGTLPPAVGGYPPTGNFDPSIFTNPAPGYTPPPGYAPPSGYNPPSGYVPPSTSGGTGWPYQNPNGGYGNQIGWQLGGLYAGFQAAILQPRLGAFKMDFVDPNVIGGAGIHDVTADPDHGLTFSPRVIVGFEGSGGLGFRARWWRFSDDSGGTARLRDNTGTVIGGTSLTSSLELTTLDLELTQSGRFQNWELMMSGGVRYVPLDYSVRTNWTDVGGDKSLMASSDFDGVGPTLGITALRSLRYWEGLTFSFNSRFSFLFGESEILQQSTGLAGAAAGQQLILNVDDVMPVWELQIGALWTRRLQNGASIYLGGFFEAQLWEFLGPSEFTSDLGFWGPTLAVGIAR